jgi:hypothetical protein
MSKQYCKECEWFIFDEDGGEDKKDHFFCNSNSIKTGTEKLNWSYVNEPNNCKYWSKLYNRG